jgi:two-component system, LytTR family, response regulator
MRVLIVDDEPLARERIEDLLRREPDVESIETCGNGDDAVARMSRRDLDLVFLDVQMPGLDGFGVLERLAPDAMPLVVFVTAYEQYAIRAFDVHALDYLVKPFDVDRFSMAMARARAALSNGGRAELDRAVQALLSATKDRAAERRHVLAIRSGQRIVPVRTEEIDWVEAEGNYVRLHVGKTSHLLRETLASLEESLDPRRFRRIHRSTIVNLDRIRELQPWFRKDFKVILLDGSELTLSRSFADRLPEFLGRESKPG